MIIKTEWAPCDVVMNDEIVYLHTHDDDFIFEVTGEKAVEHIIEGGYKSAFIRLTSDGLEVNLYLEPL